VEVFISLKPEMKLECGNIYIVILVKKLKKQKVWENLV